MNPITLILPAAWTPYLAYGDDTALSPDDIAACDRVTNENRLRGDPVEIHEHGFAWRHDAYHVMPVGADCAEFTWLV